MKKVLGISLTLLVAMGIATGCTGNKEEAPKETTGVVETVPENVENTEEAVPEEVAEDGTVDTMEKMNPATLVSSVNERLAVIIDAARDEECKQYPVEINNMNGALEMLGLSEDMVTEYAVAYAPMEAECHTVAVVKAVEGQEEAVKAGLETYKQSIVDYYTEFLPDELATVEGAEVVESNGYMMLVMCDTASVDTSVIETMLATIEEDFIVDETFVAGEEVDTEATTEEAVTEDAEVAVDGTTVNADEVTIDTNVEAQVVEEGEATEAEAVYAN